MLTDAHLRSQMDQLWDELWSGGLSNPVDAIEQISFLLFFKRLDDQENNWEKLAKLRGQPYTPTIPEKMRWRYWTKLEAAEAFAYVRDTLFPWFQNLGHPDSSFELYMKSAQFKLPKPTLLVKACAMIDGMQISAQNQDVQGDLYEYLLGKLDTAGIMGQFRTPRHIIRLMVQMIDPRVGERIGDLAAGTAGFLVNAYQYILEKNTSPSVLTYDADGWPHNLVGDRLSPEQRRFLKDDAIRGYDSDAGMTMLRIGAMNLMLHGIDAPQFLLKDTLAGDFNETQAYDVILMNPPFKGAIDKADINPTLPKSTSKTELLFLHLILRALDMGGRSAVIVPDGVLFGSSNAHVEIRRKIVEENRLDGVLSMPSGVFKPYAGVSTAVLFLTRGAATGDIWFYDMEHDGFTLDDKRNPTAANDIPDILECWRLRSDPAFQAARAARIHELRAELEPLKAQRHALHAEINRRTFESAIAAEEDGAARLALEDAQRRLANLEGQIHPLQDQFNRLSRQFWVTRAQVRANKYDLSASRYRQLEQDEVYYEEPAITMKRLLMLETIMMQEVGELQEMAG